MANSKRIFTEEFLQNIWPRRQHMYPDYETFKKAYLSYNPDRYREDWKKKPLKEKIFVVFD